jgi:pimeloyl-ACP methyl ester carboxylesterase
MPLLNTSHGELFVAQRGTVAQSSVPLVCIHGAGGSHQHWGQQLGALAERTAVTLLDLPGHGRSPALPFHRAISIAEYSAVLLALLDALDAERAVLAGHSMGGAIALWTALHAPQRVAGLVLTATGARLRVDPQILNEWQRNPMAALYLIVDGVYSSAAPPALRAAGTTSFITTLPGIFYGDLLACNQFDVSERLGEIACPTLIVCGEDDRMTPCKMSHTLHAGIAGSELVLIPQAGHMVQLEQPDAVNATLAAWFTSRFTSQYRSG